MSKRKTNPPAHPIAALPLVSVGIVLWNSRADLPGCIRSIQAQDHPAIELIAVDNASPDGSLDALIELAPQAIVVRHAANLGYGAGHNAAIRRATGKYYLAINPDIVLDRSYVSTLVSALSGLPGFGSAAGKLWISGKAEPRVLDEAGLFIDRRRHQILRGHGQVDRGQFDTAEEVFGVDGAAALYRMEMLKDIAFECQVFDELFFAYNDDIDLAWRARLAGWRAWYDPAANGYHVRRFRPGVRKPIPKHLRRMAVRNRYLMIYKNYLPGSLLKDAGSILAYELSILAYMLLFEQTSLPALLDFLGSRQQTARWRTAVRGRLRVGRDEMDAWFSRGEEIEASGRLAGAWRAVRRAAFGDW